MNIRDVDLNALADRIYSEGVLSDNDVSLANRILFDNGSEDRPCGDIVLVLGNPTCVDDRIIRGVEIARDCKAKYIVLSGGVLLPGSDKTEAIAMRDFCLSIGLPQQQIIVENKSTTTYENIIFSAPIVANLGIANPQIVVVSSSSHIRRVAMNCKKYSDIYPFGSKFRFAQSIHFSCDPNTWFMQVLARKTVATELRLIDEYIYKNGYSVFDI